MKKVFVNSLVIVMLVTLTFFACSSKYPGYEKTATGLYYKLFKVSKDTVKPKVGDWVSLTMRYTYKDSTLFNSKKAMGSPVRFQLPVSDFKGDIYEGIKLLSPGDSADFIINSDSLFKKTFRQPTRPPFIDSNSVVHFYITLLSFDSPVTLMKKEEESLKKYLADKQITVAPTPSGLYFVETAAGKGAKIDSGVWVKANFKVSLLDGKQIFSSYDRGEPLQFEYGQRFDTPGFEEGVGKMQKGGKATLIVPSKIAFGETGRGAFVPPFSPIVYEVEIVDVQTKAAHDKQVAEDKKKAEMKLETSKKQESELLKKYLKDKNITTKALPSGLIYVEKVKGTGAKAMAGKKVKVHYTGTLLNGTKFDSSRDRNEPFEFTLGQGQVIKGWDEGISLMNVGGKATLIIPSSIGYRERDMGNIPPFSTLVFDVELLGVK
ncbi:MAG: FKBP-type peptidyl-prolyl cis-trans isomerase [Bacteroidales bacterium]|nr:FKBP-type peptidyl-prolyl cis-trans isomerase [Bacteroidales bacterium]MDD4603133.1 FKBP-type peptidyl-prolyl cis-trans isomerase [Bacteroidales bacterium]